jgi:DUF2934 family protein
MSADHRLQQRHRLLADERVRKLIGRRAYEFYLERGGGHGKDQEDWARAEEEIVSLIQELIENESRRQAPQKAEAKVGAIAPEPKRPSKAPSPISPLKKKSGLTPGVKRKGIPKKKGIITSPAGSSPLSTV